MKVYISGKIGEVEISEATRNKFLNAAKVLAAEGHEAFNPCGDNWVNYLKGNHERAKAYYKRFYGEEITEFYTYCLLRDLTALSNLDAICMLPDWESSPGAKAELAFAQAIGLRVLKITGNGIIEEEK